MNAVTLSKQQIYEGDLILVNREHPFRETMPGTLTAVGSRQDVLLCRQAAEHLDALMTKLCGWHDIVPVSGQRSFAEQQKIWNDTLAESGLSFTQKYVAVPGHSEHQTGLAIDLALKQETIDFICPEFPYTGICQRFREHAADHGFIERYPAAKESITGIGHEPWHFRYVGTPHAKIMAAAHLTLEEYIDFVKQFLHNISPYTLQIGGSLVSVSYCPADDSADTVLEIDTKCPYCISGNNVDGFIITQWR